MNPGILFWILIGIGIMFLLYIRIKSVENYRKFQRTMKPGDLCFFYVNEDKIEGKINSIKLDGSIVVIEDCDGDLHHVTRYDVHPYWI